MEKTDHEDLTVFQDQLDHPEKPDQKEKQDDQEPTDFKVNVERPEHKETQELLVYQENQDQLD